MTRRPESGRGSIGSLYSRSVSGRIAVPGRHSSTVVIRTGTVVGRALQEAAVEVAAAHSLSSSCSDFRPVARSMAPPGLEQPDALESRSTQPRRRVLLFDGRCRNILPISARSGLSRGIPLRPRLRRWLIVVPRSRFHRRFHAAACRIAVLPALSTQARAAVCGRRMCIFGGGGGWWARLCTELSELPFVLDHRSV